MSVGRQLDVSWTSVGRQSKMSEMSVGRQKCQLDVRNVRNVTSDQTNRLSRSDQIRSDQIRSDSRKKNNALTY